MVWEIIRLAFHSFYVCQYSNAWRSSHGYQKRFKSALLLGGPLLYCQQQMSAMFVLSLSQLQRPASGRNNHFPTSRACDPVEIRLNLAQTSSNRFSLLTGSTSQPANLFQALPTPLLQSNAGFIFISLSFIPLF